MNQKGFSVPEVLTVVAIEAVAILVVIALVAQLLGSQVDTMNSQGVSTHELETRATMRLENSAHVNTVCFDTLKPLVIKSLPQIIDAAETNSKFVASTGQTNGFSIDLKDPNGFIDFSNLAKTADFQKYGNLSIVKTELTDFRVTRSIDGYTQNKPGYLPASFGTAKIPLMYIVSALVKTTFVKQGQQATADPKKYTSAVRINLAIRQVSKFGGFKFKSCGAKALAEITAPLEACKAFGEEFEYVYDQLDTDNEKGQCYAPTYDPTKSNPVLGANPDGTRPVSPTGYAPLKHFFCEGAYAGKSFNNAFCTGSN